jgi:urea transport system ATP-binding protein
MGRKMADRKDTILYLDNISVSFDGFKAINHLSLYITRGELRAIIGPNGAGKTTMMDIITGKTKPDTGTLLFNGNIDLKKLDEVSIAELGIGRKFQKPTIFENQTVYDNILLSLDNPRGVIANLGYVTTKSTSDKIDELLEIIRLTKYKNLEGSNLSHGQKQWLEIGMLLAQDPDVLLVDEPAAGMTDAETADTAKLLINIAKTKSVIVVEHDMEFIRALNSKVTVLHEGAVLAEGSLDQVSKNQEVIDVYLGR